jgi:hypothetical protein
MPPPGRPRWAASAMLAPPLLGCPTTSPRARPAGQPPLGPETRAVAAGVVAVAGGRPHRLLLGRCAAQPAPMMGSRRGLTERDLGRPRSAVASDTPSASPCAPKSALCPSVSLPHPAAVEPGAECFRFLPPRYGLRLGWELGHAVEWCCRHLPPAFLALLCVSQAGANAGGMRALHRSGRWTYLGWLDWVRCGWPRGRVLQVGLAKVSWTYAPSVSTIPALKLMHEAGWGASQPREQDAGDPRSVTSSRVLGVAVGGFRADV